MYESRGDVGSNLRCVFGQNEYQPSPILLADVFKNARQGTLYSHYKVSKLLVQGAVVYL